MGTGPDEICEQYGCNTPRLCEMHMGPPEVGKPWASRDIIGPFRFLPRARRGVADDRTGELRLREQPAPEVERKLHQTIVNIGAG